MPACGYSETFTSTASSSIITETVMTTALSYLARSNDVLDTGDHTVTITSTLNNAPSSSCFSTFTLTVLFSCLTTSITTFPAAVENFVAFAGYTAKSMN